MNKSEENLSFKIQRSFVVHSDVFFKFKALIAEMGFSNFSGIIEQLMVCFLEDPKILNLKKKS